jgi:CDP-diacylglycerol--serine O-phosphatidyltransferase
METTGAKLSTRKIKRARRVAAQKKRHLRYIAVLPSLITLMNGVCGFVSIFFASRGDEAGHVFAVLGGKGVSYFSLSAYLIYLAMIADVLDGRVARLTKTTSSFGGQLDSLCDAISFGVAPAFLVLKLTGEALEAIAETRPLLFLVEGRALLTCAILYASCAIIRLARFNVENEEEDPSHMNFSGLPTPPAAGVVVSFVILQQSFLSKWASPSDVMTQVFQTATIWGLPLLTVFLGILMVSRFKYPHVVNYLLRGKKSFTSFIIIFLVILLLLWNLQLAISKLFIFSVFFCFMISGVFRSIYYKKIASKTGALENPPEVHE